jgi:glycosyltransferase involved in cell wall biosynthesis
VSGKDGETCFSTEPGDSDALAATIARALDDPELRAKIGAQGRQRVIDQWSWRHTALKTLDQYWAVLDEHEARGGN